MYLNCNKKEVRVMLSNLNLKKGGICVVLLQL